MSDLTILYYTANTIPESTGQRIRNNLLKVIGDKFPILSVSQKPIKLSQNICVGEIGRSKYNEYKQILIGAGEIKTKYVACAEDDMLYSLEHFMYRPPGGVFAYETNMWYAAASYYWRWEDRNQPLGMWGCITETETLLQNLSTRYSLYPTDPLITPPGKKKSYLFWGEPGIHDQLFGMQNRHVLFESKEPTVEFLSKNSMGGRHVMGRYRLHKPEDITYNLKPFGGINKLWKTYWS